MDKMRKVILPVTMALVLLLAGCTTGSTSSGTEEARAGQSAPDFQLKDLDGQDISLSSLRGKPVLLNFWATWCPPCRAEMPYLQQIYEEWSDKGLVLLAIDIGESSARVKEFLEANNLSLSVPLDTNQIVAQKYNITGIPTTYLIDKDGIIQSIKIGSFQSKEEIEAEIRRVIP